MCIAILPKNVAKAGKVGDVNGDGYIKADDARLVLRFSVNLEALSLEQQVTADINGDGKITAWDARCILRMSVGLDIADTSQAPNLGADEKDDDLFEWVLPDMPTVNAESGTFTFTVYGYGHGVGLSQYGALSLAQAGYSYKEILSHYYTGTEIKQAEEFPAMCLYPTLEGNTYVKKKQPVKELLARIVYQEIYGVVGDEKHQEALKALIVCVFSLLAYYDFDIDSRWDVGIASPLSYNELPENLKNAVEEVFGQYMTVKGDSEPIMAVFSGLAAGMTASSKDIWGGELSYLTAVESPFDMQRDGFVSECTYTVEEMRSLIMAYDSSIVLSSDPQQWLQITEHTASMDENRGYVTKIRVGNRELSGYSQFVCGLMNNSFRSSCFVITYTP